MGYESKFYAVREYNFASYQLPEYKASEIIAMLDMCKMGYEDDVNKLLNLFKNRVPFVLYLEDGCDEKGNAIIRDTVEDCYGKHITYISNEDKEKAIKLVKEISKRDNYWRFNLLHKFLKMFKDYDDVYICHYGY